VYDLYTKRRQIYLDEDQNDALKRIAKVDYVVAFDRDFSIMGFELRP
jgi:hypothetical protein